MTAALQVLDSDRTVDVIIIARGGGSIEDLLPFSDETLVRAVAACRTPVVSAIGHEQDTPLLDLVADIRASTPTDAARRVVPDISEQVAIVAELQVAGTAPARRADRPRERLAGRGQVEAALASPARELDRRHEQILALTERARRCLAASLDRADADLVHTRARLLALSPAATLRRGYAIVQRADSSVVRSAAEVDSDETLVVRFAADQLTVTVSN